MLIPFYQETDRASRINAESLLAASDQPCDHQAQRELHQRDGEQVACGGAQDMAHIGVRRGEDEQALRGDPGGHPEELAGVSGSHRAGQASVRTAACGLLMLVSQQRHVTCWYGLFAKSGGSPSGVIGSLRCLLGIRGLSQVAPL